MRETYHGDLAQLGTDFAAVDDTNFTYSSPTVSTSAGLITSTTDKQNGGATTDTQCFTDDYADRLNAAWTGIDHCATTPANTTTIGGPNPYWESWTYDAAGDRLTQSDHGTAGVTADDTTTAYTYPTAGSGTDQPHTLTATTATGPNAQQDTADYTYDATGNTTTITSGGTLGNQTLTRTDQGKLDSDTTSAGTTNYVYDADGNLIVQRDPGQSTAYLPDEQVVRTVSTDALSATRFYTTRGTIIASRISTASGTVGNPATVLTINVTDHDDSRTHELRIVNVSGFRFFNAIESPWDYVEITEVHMGRNDAGELTFEIML